jgi:hypothetical protein
MTIELDISLTNETEGHRFAEFRDEIPTHLLRDDGRPDFGAIFRIYRGEYGRCQSSVYVGDGPDAWVSFVTVVPEQIVSYPIGRAA